MRTYKQFINGELVSRPGEGMIDVENPSSGQIMAQVPDGGAEDAQAALEAARAAQDAWATLLGLTTTAHPASRDGATLRAVTKSGKFQGQMPATTPMGWR